MLIDPTCLLLAEGLLDAVVQLAFKAWAFARHIQEKRKK